MHTRLLRPSTTRVVVLAALLSAGSARTTPALGQAPTTKVAIGFHFGSPARVSLAFGVSHVLSRRAGRWERCAERPWGDGCKAGADSAWNSYWSTDHDAFLMAEPGWKGGRLSLGFGAEGGTGSELLLTSLRASLYRRWNTGHNDPGGTYLGVEGAKGVLAELAFGLRVGVFTRIGGPTGGARTLFTLDLPIGY